MSWINKEQEQDQEEESFDVGFDIPDTSRSLKSLETQLWAAHEEESKDMEKESQGTDGNNNKKRQRPKGGSVCYCGNPVCGIGPFIERAA